jgi:hypothetical protein
MHTAYLVITALFAIVVAFSGLGKICGDPRIVKVIHETVGVPSRYLPLPMGPTPARSTTHNAGATDRP